MIKIKCTKCNKEKHSNDFHMDKRKKNGRHSNCKSCISTYRKSEKYKSKRCIVLKNRGYKILKSLQNYIAYYNEKTLKTCTSYGACEQVIAKHRLRLVKRKLEDDKLLHEDYYDTL